jgi:hypothetical protein
MAGACRAIAPWARRRDLQDPIDAQDASMIFGVIAPQILLGVAFAVLVAPPRGDAS